MKKLHLLVIVATFAGVAKLKALSDVIVDAEINTAVTTCNTKRGSITCSTSVGSKLGAPGEVEDVIIPVDKVVAVKEKTLKVTLFPREDGWVVYSFTPTAGKLANKLVYVGFRTDILKPGTFFGDKRTATIYARLQEQKEPRAVNAGEVVGTDKGLAPETWTIAEDGTWSTPKVSINLEGLFEKTGLLTEKKA